MGRETPTSTRRIHLPPPNELGGTLLVRAIAQRRSLRDFDERALTWSEIGQLLWAAQGVTDDAAGLRTTPSAGARYPLELDVATPEGVFRYRPATHALQQRISADARAELAHAAHDQSWLADAACVFCVVAVVERTARRYGARAERYVLLEAGHVAQNLLLMAASLGLGGTPVGAFGDRAVGSTLRLDAAETPLYLVAIGWPSAGSP